LRKDGSEFPVEITRSPFQVGDQRQAIYVIRNITRRMQFEQALRQSEARFQAVFEQSPVGIHLLDLDGGSLIWNQRYQEMLGYEPEELRQLGFLGYTHPEDVEKSRKSFESLIVGAAESYQIEKRFVRKDGQAHWGRFSVALARDERGQPLYIVKIVEDIEERKRVEAELEEVRQRLMDGIEAQRLLVAQELHDGPMQDLYGLSYHLAILSAGTVDEQQRGELDAVQAKMSEISGVLRSIMRELRPPTLAPFGLEHAILDHAERLQQNHPELDLRLNLTPDGTRLPERLRLALFRIYQMALANVVRHSQAGQVVVRLRLDPEQVILEIQDDGVGFEVPQRWVGLVRQGHYGLVGAAERAEAVGGRLHIESKPGEGTLVRVTAPVDPDAS
jgi:PAS domain S-box-containing protein